MILNIKNEHNNNRTQTWHGFDFPFPSESSLHESKQHEPRNWSKSSITFSYIKIFAFTGNPRSCSDLGDKGVHPDMSWYHQGQGQGWHDHLLPGGPAVSLHPQQHSKQRPHHSRRETWTTLTTTTTASTTTTKRLNRDQKKKKQRRIKSELILPLHCCDLPIWTVYRKKENNNENIS